MELVSVRVKDVEHCVVAHFELNPSCRIDTFDGTRNVFDVMLDLYLRHLAPDDAGDDNAAPLAARLVLRPSPWPRMRIARDPESGERWCCDNRRLFMHKVLGCETACAQEVAWMQEFADKRRQAPPKGAEQAQAKAQEEGRYWSTDAEGVARAREELERRVHEVRRAAVHDDA